MFSRWFSSARLTSKLAFNAKGELEILNCPHASSFIRTVFFGGAAYLYFIYQINSEGPVGTVRKYLLPICGAIYAHQLYRCSKYLLRLAVVEGGKQIHLEKHSIIGYGHSTKIVLNLNDFDGLYALGEKGWLNPFGWGQGSYKLKYSRTIIGHTLKDYVLFRIPKNYNKEALKLLLLGKPVTEKSLRQLEILKSRKLVKTREK